jgi:tetratricopeptide (TPR) repeat protein
VSRTLALLGLLALSVGCRPPVTRIVDGQVVSGHQVSAQAYATYLEARLLETAGDREGARCSYRRVLELDPDATEAMVRLAGLTCPVARAEARTLFEDAARRDPESETLWSTRAECARLARQTRDAEIYARRAWELAPTDFDTNRHLIVALLDLGRTSEAERLALGLIALRPKDPRTVRLLLEEAAGLPLTEQWALPAEASTWVRSHRPSLALLDSTERSERTKGRLIAQLDAQLDRALSAQDDRGARRIARALGRSTVQLGRRALDRGNTKLALELLSDALALAPERAELWVLALSAADLEQDQEAFARLLRELPPSSTPLDDASRELLAQLLSRRLGAEPAALVAQP